MARKINPEFLRLGINQTWPSLVYSHNNYFTVFHQDLFIRKYIRQTFRKYLILAPNIFLKWGLNGIFIQVFLFRYAEFRTQFFKFQFNQNSDNFFHFIFINEIKRLKFSIKRLTGLTHVHFLFKFLKRQKSHYFAAIGSSNLEVLAWFFFNRYKRMSSYKGIFNRIKKSFLSLREGATNFQGLKFRVSGPIKAPRVRRAFIIKKNFLGTVKKHTFNRLILYTCKTKTLSEGTISLKIWAEKRMVFKKFLNSRDLIQALLFTARKFFKQLKEIHFKNLVKTHLKKRWHFFFFLKKEEFLRNKTLQKKTLRFKAGVT